MTTSTDWGGDEGQLSDGDEDPYGRDVAGTDIQCMVQALYRRFTTEPNGLWYDVTYGLNLLSYLSDASTPVGRDRLKSQLVSQALSDERIQSAAATVVFNDVTETLTVTLKCVSDAGPFTLVLSVDDAAVKLVSASA